MRFVNAFKVFCYALSTPGGSMLLLTLILFAFFPLLVKNDSEGWKAAMFVLGAIAGLINTNRGGNSNSTATVETTTGKPKTDIKTTTIELNG